MGYRNFLIFSLFMLTWACSTKDEQVNEIFIQSIIVNNSILEDGAQQIPVNSALSITFTSAINTSEFSSLVSLTSDQGDQQLQFTFTNAGLIATAELSLDYSTLFTLTVLSGKVGANGETLNTPVNIQFTTAEDYLIKEQAPCMGVSSCIQTVEITGTAGSASLDFYSNYPLFEEKAQWEKLKYAIVVIHGLTRNADDYYSYMNSAIANEEFAENTIIVSPYFKKESSLGNNDYYWSGSGWRDGENSSNNSKISSFQVLDTLVSQLLNKELFPVLEHIIITGHSSGGLFTNVYVGATPLESDAQTSIEYVVANSQYLYYTSNMRYNESSNEFYEPVACPELGIWPMGYIGVPNYLGNVSKETFDNRFVNRSTIYLAGNGTAPDGSLNTTKCEATLLGSTRYQRSVNRFLFMNEFYTANNAHNFIEVEGIGHNGQAMFNSSEFKNYLVTTFQ